MVVWKQIKHYLINLSPYRCKKTSWLMLTTLLFLLLTSEFIAEGGNEKFWEFVDTVKELTVYKHGGMFITQNYITFQLCLFFFLFFLVKCNVNNNADVSHRICALLLQLDPEESRAVSYRSSSQPSQICAVTSILLTSHTRIPAGLL